MPAACHSTVRALASALIAVLLAAAVALGGCSRAVTFGPAGEPAATRPPAQLRFTVETDAAHAAAAEVYATQLSRLGARVKVQVLDRSEVVRRARAGESDACLLGWSGATSDPLAVVPAKLGSSGVENYSGYDNPELDRLLAALVGRSTPEEKAAYARFAQELLYEEAPLVYGVRVPLHDASASALTGWRPGPAGAVFLRDATLAGGQDRVVVGLGLPGRPRLDPLEPIDPAAATLFRCLFDALVSVGPDGTLLPELAESWEYSTNARRLTVKLRGGVTFHNGAALRPEDVVFTYERTLPGRLPAPVQVTVEAREGGTVEFIFRDPFPNFLDVFGLQPIVPASYYQAVGPEGFSQAPVGTGPFRLNPARTDRQLVLERWERYYGGCPSLGPGQRARLKEVSFVFAADPDRRLAMLERGDIALAPALLPGEAEAVRARTGATVVPEPGWTILALEPNNRRPPFDDARVRQALNLAVDRQTLADALGPGTVVLPGVFLPDSFGFRPEAGAFSPDLAKARSLLGEAGYLVPAD